MLRIISMYSSPSTDWNLANKQCPCPRTNKQTTIGAFPRADSLDSAARSPVRLGSPIPAGRHRRPTTDHIIATACRPTPPPRTPILQAG